MEEIKQEILSLSEKYSVKCVESAALEEKLYNVTQQLTQAQQHIMQLDARYVVNYTNTDVLCNMFKLFFFFRNKQLRTHLMSEINEINNADSTQTQIIKESASPVSLLYILNNLN